MLEVIQEEIRVEDRIKYILDVLEEREWIEFSALFAKLNMSRQLIIVSFIALLELIKQKKIYARQSRPFKEIRLYRIKDAGKNEAANEQAEQGNPEADKQVEFINEIKKHEDEKDSEKEGEGE